MVHLILTGATGMVGSGVLDTMIKSKEVTKISILSRSPVKLAADVQDPRVTVIIYKDFEKYPEDLLSQLKGATGCVWALGTSQTKVNKEDYVRITKSFTVEAAKAFQILPPENEPFNFVFVSGYGATVAPNRFSAIFARVKGETELELAEMRKANPLLHAVSVRPSFVTASAHDTIKPYVPPRTAYEGFVRRLEPGFRNLLPSVWSPTEQLGAFLTGLAMGRYQDQLSPAKDITFAGSLPILENTAFRRLMGLKN